MLSTTQGCVLACIQWKILAKFNESTDFLLVALVANVKIRRNISFWPVFIKYSEHIQVYLNFAKFTLVFTKDLLHEFTVTWSKKLYFIFLKQYFSACILAYWRKFSGLRLDFGKKYGQWRSEGTSSEVSISNGAIMFIVYLLTWQIKGTCNNQSKWIGPNFN